MNPKYKIGQKVLIIFEDETQEEIMIESWEIIMGQILYNGLWFERQLKTIQDRIEDDKI